MIKASLKYFLIGLLVWPITAEIIGFISPFYSVFVIDDTSGKNGVNLLSVFQPYLPLFSVIFAYSFYLISRLNVCWIKVRLCDLLALVYVCLSIYGFFPEDGITYSLLSSLHYLAELIMLFFGVFLIYKNVPEIHNKSLKQEK